MELNPNGSLNDYSDSNAPASSGIAISRKLASQRRGSSDSPIGDLSFRNAGFRRALYRHGTGPVAVPVALIWHFYIIPMGRLITDGINLVQRPSFYIRTHVRTKDVLSIIPLEPLVIIGAAEYVNWAWKRTIAANAN